MIEVETSYIPDRNRPHANAPQFEYIVKRNGRVIATDTDRAKAEQAAIARMDLSRADLELQIAERKYADYEHEREQKAELLSK